ncbi:LysM peptidoglycan-binding domain-containing protein [Rossellomorea aquimaris]|uniref:3D domain-containing protein n=1 Tax=Rossellomorea aquimaris TaxID=189382 RepID=UPI001CD60345|nr:3D domain-containing protein [Rossellomorea aquimaris]MCA1053819.1 LysM peptidoglycan-binding domain-containing protein [Rossellomorea aquimaris]
MKKVLFSIISFTFILSIGVLSVEADTDDNTEKALNDYHNIKKGDILWEIANRYHISIEEAVTRQELLENGVTVNGEESQDQGVKTATSEENDSKVTKEVNVTATAYTAHCEGCIGITKTGVDLLSNPDARVIAVDPDVIPLGSKVYIEGYGYARAEDTGGAIKGNRIDIYMEHEQDALEYGVRDVKVKIIEE